MIILSRLVHVSLICISIYNQEKSEESLPDFHSAWRLELLMDLCYWAAFWSALIADSKIILWVQLTLGGVHSGFHVASLLAR